jgi:hypothetical protein
LLAKNYADPTRPNKSHDLGLILDFSDFQQEQQITLPLPDHLFRGHPPQLKSFPEYKSSRGIKRKNGKTVKHTVSDLCFHLETHREWTTNTIFDDTRECMGDIHVYSDGRPYRLIYRQEPSMKPVTAKNSK